MKQTRAERWDDWKFNLEQVDLICPGASTSGLELHKELQQLRQHADALRETLGVLQLLVDHTARQPFRMEATECYDKFLQEEVE